MRCFTVIRSSLPFHRYHILFISLLLPTVFVLGYLMRAHRADDAYITYRYAQNLMRGKGFVFNVGENVLGTTAPFHGLLLAGLGKTLVMFDLPILANLLGFFSAFVLASVMVLILAYVGRPRGGIASGLLIATMTHTYLNAPMETILVAALSWAVTYFYLKDDWWGVSVLGALALITRLDAALLLVCVYFAHWIHKRQSFRLVKHGAITLALTLPWLVFAYLSYGSPVPNSAMAKSGWEDHLFEFLKYLWPKVLQHLIPGFPWLSTLIVLLALVGLMQVISSKKSCHRLWVIPAWMVIYTIAYTIMQIGYPFHWFYFPLICAVVFLGSFAVDSLLLFMEAQIKQRLFVLIGLRAGATLVLVLIVALQVRAIVLTSLTLSTNEWSGGRDRIYKTVALWLHEHTSPTATIAAAEVGTIAYYSDRKIIDLLGLVTPQVADHIKRGDYGWAIEFHSPDYIVVNEYLKHVYQFGDNYHRVANFKIDAYPYAVSIFQLDK